MDLVKANIFADLKVDGENEVVEKILSQGNVQIERIISTGQSSPEHFWYDQPHSEWVIVLKGRGVIEFEDAKIELEQSDYIFIPPHRKHRVELTDPQESTVWLAVHFK